MADNREPPGLLPVLHPAEAAGARPVEFDRRAFEHPAYKLARLCGIVDRARLFSSVPIALVCARSAYVLARAGLLLARLPGATARRLAAWCAAIVGVGAAVSAVWGPLRRLLRARLRSWYSGVAGRLVDHPYTDPGCVARDASADEPADAVDGGVDDVDDSGRPIRRKRTRYYVPYEGGEVRGAYLANVVAETRSNYAGRPRDPAAEHGARREMVTRMRDHGMRATDIDKVREAMVNAVFYRSIHEEAGEQLEFAGRILGLQRGQGPGY